MNPATLAVIHLDKLGEFRYNPQVRLFGPGVGDGGQQVACGTGPARRSACVARASSIVPERSMETLYLTLPRVCYHYGVY